MLELARAHDIEAIEGTCEGCMACATCHVIVDEAWFAELPPIRPEEDDMLDFADHACATSRLGCQIRVTPALDGLVVHLPRGEGAR